ncbi:MAG TPA: hypothetical protein VJV78_43090 [Polyangiales bacterium]|nr:hypothetical protein [Polyangiales bacterium]
MERASGLLAREAARLPTRPASRDSNQLGNASQLSAFLSALAALDPAELQARILDLLRRAFSTQAQDGERAANAGQVPIIWCAAKVQAGSSAHATICIANDESRPEEVSLYMSNFIADSGYEIPAIAGLVIPRRAQIPAGADLTFEVEIRVPVQARAGTYSSLIQATNSRYVKAVLMLEVA